MLFRMLFRFHCELVEHLMSIGVAVVVGTGAFRTVLFAVLDSKEFTR
jgi:hypothetical protein